MSATPIHRRQHNLQIPDDIMIQFQRANTAQEFRSCLLKGGKWAVKQAEIHGFGSVIKPISPVNTYLKTMMQTASMGAEAATATEAAVVVEAIGAAETLTLSAEAATIMAGEAAAAGTAATAGAGTGAGAAGAGIGLGPAVAIVIIVIVVIWCLTRSYVDPNKRPWLDNALRSLITQLKK